ncbi:hypothetical protein C0993_010686 [Termitomyces sp. T159_Od127]|nr:hypothetical protein C0993_010686 [Termitomyces sp. T159_Od127]
MAIQSSVMSKIPQVKRFLVALKFMAYTAAVFLPLFLAGGVALNNRLASSHPSTITTSHLSPTPTSPKHTPLHFPWVFVTFFVLTVTTTAFLLMTSAPAPNPLTSSSSSLCAFDSPVHARAQVGHADDKAQGELVSAKRHLVAHMLSRFLRAIIYGVIIRECLPTMAVFFTRWAAPNWMANCAGALTTLVALTPTVLRRCFSYTICLVYLQWPVSSDRPKTSPICPTMSVATSSPVDGRDPRDTQETSNQALQETVTAPETTPCDNAPIPEPQVSLRNDVTESTQAGTVIQDTVSDDYLGGHVKPQPETCEDLERTMSSVHPLPDNTFTAITETVTEEPLRVSRGCEATFDERGNISSITVSVIEIPSIDDDEQHHSLVESPTKATCIHSHSLPGAVASLIETTLDDHVAEVSGSPDNAQATSSCPTPSDHVDALAIPPSPNEVTLPDPHTSLPISELHSVDALAIPPSPNEVILPDTHTPLISEPHRIEYLTELPFNGEDLSLIDALTVQLSSPEISVLVHSPNRLVEPELSPFHNP